MIQKKYIHIYTLYMQHVLFQPEKSMSNELFIITKKHIHIYTSSIRVNKFSVYVSC
jgi:hypothetical protein